MPPLPYLPMIQPLGTGVVVLLGNVPAPCQPDGIIRFTAQQVSSVAVAPGTPAEYPAPSPKSFCPLVINKLFRLISSADSPKDRPGHIARDSRRHHSARAPRKGLGASVGCLPRRRGQVPLGHGCDGCLASVKSLSCDATHQCRPASVPLAQTFSMPTTLVELMTGRTLARRVRS
jgi:hypothetical protein